MLLALSAGVAFGQEGMSDLKALLETKVISASRVEEALGGAPASVIVLQQEDLQRRGYLQLSEILDDLPGIDVVRPFGDNFVRPYWRGARSTIGEPFLLMLDGLVLNHLYFNTADGALAALPLSNVERLEVVYGPASALYGANALRGVINVITRRNVDQEGVSGNATLAAGRWDRKVADLHAFYKAGDLRFSFTARSELGAMDQDAAERYELTKGRYTSDRRLWGAFLDNPAYGGTNDGPCRTQAFDFRAFLGQLEVGWSSQMLESGYGNEYPGDVAQNHAVWARPESMAWARPQTSRTATTPSRARAAPAPWPPEGAARPPPRDPGITAWRNPRRLASRPPPGPATGPRRRDRGRGDGPSRTTRPRAGRRPEAGRRGTAPRRSHPAPGACPGPGPPPGPAPMRLRPGPGSRPSPPPPRGRSRTGRSRRASR
jgi:outer membrane receptor protein involved in Fe transport